MRLVRAHVRNFKLLEDIQLDFSTDASKPLTIIRAENGSGKTSVLYALLWAFYGMSGLPSHARGLRLTSSAAPAGLAVDVSVMIEFEHTDESDITSRYRLIRTVRETPSATDSVDRSAERARLLRITSAGEEDIAHSEALIEKFVPLRLRDVFFTNGDDVQTFISGREGSQQRQDKVHRAIQALLGLEAMRVAMRDLEDVFKAARGTAAKSAGADVEAAESSLEKTDSELKDIVDQFAGLSEQRTNMAEEEAKWQKELTALRGFGDIDELNQRIAEVGTDIAKLEAARARSLSRMRELLRSEECSWAFLGDRLETGVKLLGDLADRHVIPGTSVEVLTDRLELGECICGQPLMPGTPHHAQVERLRDEQLRVSDSQQRLTSLFHTARQSKANHEAKEADAQDFPGQRDALRKEYLDTRDLLATRGLELKQIEERRRQIDAERVKQLTADIDKVRAQMADTDNRLGALAAKRDQLNQIRAQQDGRLREAERAAKVSSDLTLKRDVAEDMFRLAEDTLGVLEGDYVTRTSSRVAELFLEIVGSHPDFDAGVFTGVHIANNFDIVVDTHDGRQLDPDFELNGASQRALTLAFIWALMEVSGTTAPRIIDAPLGMVAGGVKTRMVDVITRPPTGSLPDFQVILLLTRSEIRDVEDLLDTRAGKVSTLSCSKDYPEDLSFDWEMDRPIVRACGCSHRESCDVCARRYDEQHGIVFRERREVGV